MAKQIKRERALYPVDKYGNELLPTTSILINTDKKHN